MADTVFSYEEQRAALTDDELKPTILSAFKKSDVEEMRAKYGL